MSEIYSGTTVKINKNNVNKYKAEISEIIGKTYQDLKILPDEYTQLDYIEATGTQYFDTGYLPKDTSKYEFLGTIVAVPTSARPGTYLFGENDEDDINTPESQLYCSSYIKINRPGSIKFVFGHDEYGNEMQFTLSSTLSPTYIGTKHKFVLNKESVYIDNELMNTFSETTVSFSKEKSLYLFALHYTDLGRVESAEIGPTTIQINNFKIYEGDSLKHNFIPCKRNSDNELGLYDYVTKAFKTNAGTGTFNAGPVSTLPNEDYQIPSIDYPSEVRAVGDNIQLFDKENANILNAYVYVNNTNIVAEEQARTLYIPCDENKNYTISKLPSSLNVGYTKDIPTIGGRVYDTVNATSGATKLTYKTGVEAKYLVVFFHAINNEDYTLEEILDSIKICEGTETGAWSPYGMGSISVVKSNGNLAKIVEDNFELTENNTIKNIKRANNVRVIENIKIKAGQTVKVRFKLFSKPTAPTTFTAYKNDISTTLARLNITNFNNFNLNQNYDKTWIATEDCEIYYMAWGDGNNDTFEFQLSVSIDEAIDYIKHEDKEYVVTTQEPFYEGDTFVKIDGVRYEKHLWDKLILTGDERNWAIYIQNNIAQFFNKSLIRMSNQDGKCTHFKVTDVPPLYVEEEIMNIYMFKTLEGFGIFLNTTDFPTIESFTAKLQELYNSGNPVRILYKPTEPKLIPCTKEQNAILDELENLFLYDGTTYIYSNDEIEPDLVVIVKKLIEDYNFYISSDGYLVITDFNIKYLIDLNESNIPIMPEATESSVRAAGRDGDIVLNTTYEPVSFEIVCYTEDNLTQEEKIIAEKNINRFLNSIKNKTIAIAFENNNSFYKVKYNGLLVTTNYPKHLKFTIPLKSSDSYGKDLMQRSIVGNSTGESDTIEDVGAIFIINGPALNPIISLNDYSMEYTTSILEGARVEIDSNKSTIININNDGIKTNVMKYYNHQFPKIQNGTNTLKILSGLDNDKNVSVKWYDLKL